MIGREYDSELKGSPVAVINPSLLADKLSSHREKGLMCWP
jgi:hypothetical protein